MKSAKATVLAFAMGFILTTIASAAEPKWGGKDDPHKFKWVEGINVLKSEVASCVMDHVAKDTGPTNFGLVAYGDARERGKARDMYKLFSDREMGTKIAKIALETCEKQYENLARALEGYYYWHVTGSVDETKLVTGDADRPDFETRKVRSFATIGITTAAEVAKTAAYGYYVSQFHEGMMSAKACAEARAKGEVCSD